MAGDDIYCRSDRIGIFQGYLRICPRCIGCGAADVICGWLWIARQHWSHGRGYHARSRRLLCLQRSFVGDVLPGKRRLRLLRQCAKLLLFEPVVLQLAE